MLRIRLKYRSRQVWVKMYVMQCYSIDALVYRATLSTPSHIHTNTLDFNAPCDPFLNRIFPMKIRGLCHIGAVHQEHCLGKTLCLPLLLQCWCIAAMNNPNIDCHYTLWFLYKTSFGKIGKLVQFTRNNGSLGDDKVCLRN